MPQHQMYWKLVWNHIALSWPMSLRDEPVHPLSKQAFLPMLWLCWSNTTFEIYVPTASNLANEAKEKKGWLATDKGSSRRNDKRKLKFSAENSSRSFRCLARRSRPCHLEFFWGRSSCGHRFPCLRAPSVWKDGDHWPYTLKIRRVWMRPERNLLPQLSGADPVSSSWHWWYLGVLHKVLSRGYQIDGTPALHSGNMLAFLPAFLGSLISLL